MDELGNDMDGTANRLDFVQVKSCSYARSDVVNLLSFFLHYLLSYCLSLLRAL